MTEDVEDLSNTVNQFGLIDIYRTLHQQLKNMYYFQVYMEHQLR